MGRKPRLLLQLFLEVAARTGTHGRYSGSRISLLAAPSHPNGQWHSAVFVPGYSSGTATDSHRASLAQWMQKQCVPGYLLSGAWPRWLMDSMDGIQTNSMLCEGFGNGNCSQGWEELTIQGVWIIFMPRPFREVIAHFHHAWAGLLASESSYRPRLPIPPNGGTLRLSSSVTAARLRRILTVLPLTHALRFN